MIWGETEKINVYASVRPASSLVLCCIGLPYNLFHAHVQFWPTESLMVYDFDIFFPAYTVEISFFVFFFVYADRQPTSKGGCCNEYLRPPPPIHC